LFVFNCHPADQSMPVSGLMASRRFLTA
jgi:hypothetical protein